MASWEGIRALVARAGDGAAASGAIFLLCAALYWGSRRGLSALQRRRYLPEPLAITLRRIAFWLIASGGVVLVLQALGVLESVFGALTGIFALVAIGFVAVWSVLSNTLCSLILMVVRPFRVGDQLSFPPDDLSGTVVNFNMLFTTLETEEGLLLQVPNNSFFQRPILRKKGALRIGLSEQLYREHDAPCGGASSVSQAA